MEQERKENLPLNISLKDIDYVGLRSTVLNSVTMSQCCQCVTMSELTFNTSD